MKRLIFYGCVLFFFFPSVFAQEVIENPSHPDNPDAGRTLKLEEELRITDESGKFFFQYPRAIKVAPDESLYIYDSEQLLHLDKEGHFLHNLFKKGQGPGEVNYLSNYAVMDDAIIVNGTNPGKLIFFNFEGDFQNEISLRQFSSTLRLLFVKEGRYFFLKSDFPRSDKVSEIIGWPHVLCSMSGSMEMLEDLFDFPIETLVMGGAAVSNLSILTVLIQDRYLCVSHTAEYKIRIFDLTSHVLFRDVTRKYKRIARPKGRKSAAIIIKGRRHEAPGSEYLTDISQLFEFKGKLWVQTSTRNDKKGILFDVYNIQGDYLDAFYLDAEKSVISTHKSFLFVREKDENELLSIVKYRVINAF